MIENFGPISAKIPNILHGGDYNPDQWRHMDEILTEDVRLMKLAGCNAMSIGIFAWAALEPDDGVYTFEWMDAVLDRLYENGGDCHCELCQEAFRDWLKQKYSGDLDELNRRWWGTFWSHSYSDWSQIQSPAPHGESGVHAHNLDWRRFVTDQTVDFMRAEIAPLKAISPDLPVTTNMMGTYYTLNYWKFAPYLDVISWDSYPCWHGTGEKSDHRLASDIGFVHDLNRSLKKGKPFMLMESTPSMTNWQDISKKKRPGMHALTSLQAVAHGSDTVQYFQWRKSRGSFEKFHGAVVDHVGHENTRVFGDVKKVGAMLSKLDGVVGTGIEAKVAIVFDWENRWAMDDAKGPRNSGGSVYERICKDHYHQLWRRGIAVDVVDMDADFSGYRLVIAPMLYMVRGGVGERITSFVEKGGTFVTTYWSGIVNEDDLCYLGGFPGPLLRVLGIWSEEIDALYPGETNAVVPEPGNSLGLVSEYEAIELCDLIHSEGATVLASYGADFYKGRPALTVNSFGEGSAYYIASRNSPVFLDDFYGRVCEDLELSSPLEIVPPEGVSVTCRQDEEGEFVFLLNFNPEPQVVGVGAGGLLELLSGETVSGEVSLGPYGVAVLNRR